MLVLLTFLWPDFSVTLFCHHTKVIFERDRQVDAVCRIMGVEEWLDKFGKVSNDGKVDLLWEKV